MICIVRSHNNPQAKSEVITLDHASSEFLSNWLLTARRSNPGI